MDDFAKIREMMGNPHRIGPEAGDGMLFNDEIDPFTGKLTGRKIMKPMVRAALGQQGYDADDLERRYRESREANDPTIIDGTVVRRALTPPEG